MVQLKRKPGVAWLPLVLFVLFASCAPAYDWYPCGNVSCYYCPPNALPYACWQSHNCSDSPGQMYLAETETVPIIDVRSQTTEKPAEPDYFLAPPEK